MMEDDGGWSPSTIIPVLLMEVEPRPRLDIAQAAVPRARAKENS